MHANFLDFILPVFNKKWDNVVYLISDNCSKNKSITSKLELPMIGCHRLRFKAAVQNIPIIPVTNITVIFTIMQKLRNLISADSEIRLQIHPVRMNKTQSSSAYHMLGIKFSLRSFLLNLGVKEMKNLLPSPRVEGAVEEFFGRLHKLDSVTQVFQCDTTSLHEARILFDIVVSDFSETEPELKKSADIVHFFHT